jgi:hypothetical protein
LFHELPLRIGKSVGEEMIPSAYYVRKFMGVEFFYSTKLSGSKCLISVIQEDRWMIG